jgi:HK97 family phage portal protein
VFDNLRYYISTKLNPAQPSIAIESGTVIPPTNILDFKEAYREIEIVYRCLDMIVNAAVEIPFLVEAESDRPPTDRINKLLNYYPNPFEDKFKLFRKAYLDLYLDGNAFFYYDSKENKLYHLPANRVSIVPDERRYIKKFVYNYGIGSFGGSVNKNIDYAPEDVVHIKADSSVSEFRGDSKLLNLKRLMELYYSLIDFQKQFFKNGAVPGIVLQTDNVLSKTVKDRLLEHWKAVYNVTFQGARSPAILDGGLKVDKLGAATLVELDFENSVERVQQDIAKSLGVPYVLLKSGNNANLQANQQLFYEQTILPLVNLFASAFQHFFMNQGMMDIYPDKSNILCLQADLGDQALYYTGFVNAGILTPNEAREAIKYPAIAENQAQDPTKPGGDMDKVRIPQNITGSATKPEQGGKPPDDGTHKPSGPKPKK